MKTIHSLFISILLLSISVSAAYAQAIDPKVEVSREFDVKLIEINKPNLSTKIADSLSKFNISFDYSVFEKPYKDLYEFVPHRSLLLEKNRPQEYPLAYLKLGMQYPIIPSGEFYIQKNKENGFSISAYGQHNSYFPWKSESVATTNMIRNSLGVEGKYIWSTGSTTLDLFYNNTQSKTLRPVSSMIDSMGVKNGRFGLRAKVGSFNRESKGVLYDLSVTYLSTQAKQNFANSLESSSNRAREDRLDVTARLGGKYERLFYYLEFINSTSFMNSEIINRVSDNSSLVSIPLPNYYAGIFALSPQVKYSTKRFNGLIGLSLEGKYRTNVDVKDELGRIDVMDASGNLHKVMANHQKSITPLLLKVDMEYELIKNYVWVRGYLNGKNELNSLTHILNNNPWFIPTQYIDFTSTPYVAGFTVKGKFMDRFSVNIFGSHSKYNNRLLVSYQRGGYQPNYVDMKESVIGAEVLWKSDGLIAGLELVKKRYNISQGIKPYLLPEYEGNIFAQYNWRDKIIADISLGYRSEVYSNNEEKEDSYFNLRLNLSYRLTRSLSVFLKGENLLNDDIYYVPGFDAPGINFGGGIVMKF